ncbi:MAG: cytidyltransferase, partial [Candidatus Eremiobacterota bacterium]
ILSRLDRPPDLLFASEDYGRTLAEVIGARFVLTPGGRTLVPVSGTSIREDPQGHREFLPPPVRAWYGM